MKATSRHLRQLGLGAAVALASVLAASCDTSVGGSAPREVQASNPTVTYKYHNDDELLQSNALAVNYCSQYKATPRALNFARDEEHTNVVVYECTPGRWDATGFDPALSYTYRSDQELLNGSQSAQAYCMEHGSARVESHITHNGDGTRTVTFVCGPT